MKEPDSEDEADAVKLKEPLQNLMEVLYTKAVADFKIFSVFFLLPLGLKGYNDPNQYTVLVILSSSVLR